MPTALIVCSVSSFGAGIYFHNWDVFFYWGVYCILLFPVAFFVEFFHLNMARPILRMIDKTNREKRGH
jgi:hypothetical protein